MWRAPHIQLTLQHIGSDVKCFLIVFLVLSLCYLTQFSPLTDRVVCEHLWLRSKSLLAKSVHKTWTPTQNNTRGLIYTIYSKPNSGGYSSSLNLLKQSAELLMDNLNCFIVAWLMFWQCKCLGNEWSHCDNRRVLLHVWSDDKSPLTCREGPTDTCSS